MKLFLMKVGSARLPLSMGPGIVPVPAYLIETDTGEHILIDTGFSKRVIGAYHQAPDLPHIMDASDYVVNQLARLGLAPQDIHMVICTHFDPDHAGNLADFPQATVVVQRRLYQAAITGEVARFGMTQEQWSAPGLRFLLVDGDTTLMPGITVVESSGHAPGHQSVLVQLPETGPVLLAIDAIPSSLDTDPETRPVGPFDLDEKLLRASTRKLRMLEQSEGVALTVYGHDPEQWRDLRLLPDFYA